jgi:hypothetical protein
MAVNTNANAKNENNFIRSATAPETILIAVATLVVENITKTVHQMQSWVQICHLPRWVHSFYGWAANNTVHRNRTDWIINLKYFV